MKLDLVVFLSVLRKFWVLEPLGLRILSLYYHHHGSAGGPRHKCVKEPALCPQLKSSIVA